MTAHSAYTIFQAPDLLLVSLSKLSIQTIDTNPNKSKYFIVYCFMSMVYIIIICAVRCIQCTVFTRTVPTWNQLRQSPICLKAFLLDLCDPLKKLEPALVHCTVHSIYVFLRKYSIICTMLSFILWIVIIVYERQKEQEEYGRNLQCSVCIKSILFMQCHLLMTIFRGNEQKINNNGKWKQRQNIYSIYIIYVQIPCTHNSKKKTIEIYHLNCTTFSL